MKDDDDDVAEDTNAEPSNLAQRWKELTNNNCGFFGCSFRRYRKKIDEKFVETKFCVGHCCKEPGCVENIVMTGCRYCSQHYVVNKAKLVNRFVRSKTDTES